MIYEAIYRYENAISEENGIALMFWMTCVLCTQTHFAHGRLYREILFIYALKPYTDIKKSLKPQPAYMKFSVKPQTGQNNRGKPQPVECSLKRKPHSKPQFMRAQTANRILNRK